MRKIYFTSILTLAIIALVIYVFFNRVNESQLDHQKNIIVQQVEKCGANLEKHLSEYESDLNKIIYKHINNIHRIFQDKDAMSVISRDLELFYSEYRDLVSSIAVYDNQNRFLGIYISDQDDFVIDTFARQANNELEPRDIVKTSNSGYDTYVPYFLNGDLTGNIVVKISLEKYLRKVFEHYRIEGLIYQWVASREGKVVYSNFDEKFEIEDTDIISESIVTESPGSLQHKMKLAGERIQVLSAYYPLNIMQNDMALAFSINSGHLTEIFLTKNLNLTIILSLIFLALITYLIFLLYKRQDSGKQIESRLVNLKMIMEHFPIGIMVLDQHGLIKMINQTGQKMLFIDKNEDLIGKKFDEQFLVSNNYLLKDEHSSGLDEDHLIHYVRDGNEIVIYRKDEVRHIQGEKLTISALMDVSTIEKSRKKEMAANRAKSDFLAKMSHEIRTPMNGIIGMTEGMLLEDLPADTNERLKIVHNSAELLLNLINDILDFSKIEAGKMMLEEIPFTLSEEIKITAGLFESIAKEKDLNLNIEIGPDVPDHLIGDPFRIRQVISNLLSNAIKFTNEGSVNLSIDVVEKLKKGITLRIAIEDTGIGISKDKIDTIFGNYGQAAGGTSRKYGGTGLGMAISKQLVELMNGEIWIESPAAENSANGSPGTRVAFTVELFSDEKLQKEYDFSSVKSFNQITALILSRKKDANDRIHRVLDSFGINYKYRLYDDKSIDSVIYHIEQKANLYQVIIIKDKPGYDGFGMALQLKENNISSRFLIIMSTSNEKPGNYLRCRSLDIDHYIIQPYDSHEVFEIFKKSFPNVEDQKGIIGQINKIRSNLRILIVEDNIINQRVVQSLFKHLGHEVDFAGNGEEAVKMVGENTYDVVFMDILMPVMDGLTATRKIRETGNDVTIVAMTGSDESEKRDEAFSAGMNDFINKPVKVEAIKRLLIKWFSESLLPDDNSIIN